MREGAEALSALPAAIRNLGPWSRGAEGRRVQHNLHDLAA